VVIKEDFMNAFTMCLVGINFKCPEYPVGLLNNLKQQGLIHLLRLGWVSPLMLVAMFVFLSTNAACAQESDESMTIHVVYGKLHIDNDDPDLEGGDFDIELFGADAQKAFGGENIKYGIEVGGLFSWDSEIRSFAASSGSRGGTLAVSLDINSFLFDYYFGGYLSLEPARWARLYVGAGPLIIWGWRKTENKTTDTQTAATESQSGLGTGLYGRAGLDIMITKIFGLTAGARINTTTLSFEDAAGEVDVEGLQYFGGFVYRF
jgi:hypothetical protein